MNPTFTVSIDTEKRKAKASGAVAVGEKVDVVITGLDGVKIPEWEQDNDEGFSGPALRFRLVAPDGKDLVRFPLAEGDSWTVNEDGTLSAEMDFNTAELRRWMWGFPVDGATEVGVIVDSVVDAMEYGRGTAKILQWAASPAEDPTILPNWRETLRRLNADILILQQDLETVEQSKSDAQAAAANAQTSANSASGSANDALRNAERAQGFKSDAETAATTATTAATTATTAATTATAKAGAAADSEHAAAQILENIETAIASKAEQSALDAETTRATQAESALTAELHSAKTGISANANAISQLAAGKADKTALSVLSDAIAAEAQTREERDAAICEKLNQEIGNRTAADNLKADKATTYTKTEVDAKLAQVHKFTKYLVSVLPAVADADMKGLYLVPTGETGDDGRDLCDEYTVVETNGVRRWERVGGAAVNLSGYYDKTEVDGKLAAKQNALTFDSMPTAGSANPVTSGGVNTALSNKADKSQTYTKSEVDNALDVKADKDEVNTALDGKADMYRFHAAVTPDDNTTQVWGEWTEADADSPYELLRQGVWRFVRKLPGAAVYADFHWDGGSQSWTWYDSDNRRRFRIVQDVDSQTGSPKATCTMTLDGDSTTSVEFCLCYFVPQGFRITTRGGDHLIPGIFPDTSDVNSATFTSEMRANVMAELAKLDDWGLLDISRAGVESLDDFDENPDYAVFAWLYLSHVLHGERYRPVGSPVVYQESGSIAKWQLAPAVQTSLGKADTALQPVSGATQNNIVVFGADGTVKDSGKTVGALVSEAANTTVERSTYNYQRGTIRRRRESASLPEGWTLWYKEPYYENATARQVSFDRLVFDSDYEEWVIDPYKLNSPHWNDEGYVLYDWYQAAREEGFFFKDANGTEYTEYEDWPSLVMSDYRTIVEARDRTIMEIGANSWNEETYDNDFDPNDPVELRLPHGENGGGVDGPVTDGIIRFVLRAGESAPPILLPTMEDDGGETYRYRVQDGETLEIAEGGENGSETLIYWTEIDYKTFMLSTRTLKGID